VIIVSDFHVHSLHCIYGHVFSLRWRLVRIYAVPNNNTVNLDPRFAASSGPNMLVNKDFQYFDNVRITKTSR